MCEPVRSEHEIHGDAEDGHVAVPVWRFATIGEDRLGLAVDLALERDPRGDVPAHAQRNGILVRVEITGDEVDQRTGAGRDRRPDVGRGRADLGIAEVGCDRSALFRLSVDEW